jgi:hypothetical protein
MTVLIEPNISYTSRVASNPSLNATMREKGIEQAEALLDAVIFEVDELNRGKELAPSFDEELWASVGYLVEAEQMRTSRDASRCVLRGLDSKSSWPT